MLQSPAIPHTMNVHPSLPFDILELIIDSLGEPSIDWEAIDRDSTKALQALSRTCKSMVPPCRKHLFSTVHIGDNSKSDRFHSMVSKNPDIISYARDLKLKTSIPMKTHDCQILELLKEKSPTIQYISLWSFHTWDSFPKSIQALLEYLLQLPSVTFITLYQLDEIPISLLSVCKNIPRIALDNVKITPPDALPGVTPSAVLRPSYLRVAQKSYTSIGVLLRDRHSHNYQSIIDFSRLQALDFSVELAEQMLVVSDIIQCTETLYSLGIMVEGPAGWKGFGQGFRKSQARWSLKKVRFDVFVIGDDYDPLCGLPQEIGIIAGENSIEKLEIGITVNIGSPCRTETDDWSAIDTILTSTGSFPKLKTVFIDVFWTLYAGDSDSGSEKLGGHQFPRLAGSNSIEFIITVDREYV